MGTALVSRDMRTKLVWTGLLLGVFGGSSCDSESAHPSATPGAAAARAVAVVAPEPLDLERQLISLSKTPGSVTAMNFYRTTSPPWEKGNTRAIRVVLPAVKGGVEEHANWRIVNIHAENLTEITRRLGIDLIEVQILHRRQAAEIQETGRLARKIIADNGYALITDRRIPNEWLLVEPRCKREIGRQLQEQYPDAFRGVD